MLPMNVLDEIVSQARDAEGRSDDSLAWEAIRTQADHIVALEALRPERDRLSYELAQVTAERDRLLDETTRVRAAIADAWGDRCPSGDPVECVRRLAQPVGGGS